MEKYMKNYTIFHEKINKKLLLNNELIYLSIEIGAEGSGVKITRAQWETANSISTFTEMRISSVTAAFSVNTLLKSNFGGGENKIQSNSDQRTGLDKQKMSAIISID